MPPHGTRPEPYAAEAKEFLRKSVIGKKVRVVPEYKRSFAATEGAAATERTFAALFLNGDKNVAVNILAEGLAQVSKHGQSDSELLTLRSTPRGRGGGPRCEEGRAQWWRRSARSGGRLDAANGA